MDLEAIQRAGSRASSSPDPLRRRPGPRPPRRRRLDRGAAPGALRVAFSMLRGRIDQLADVVLPGGDHAEKEGTVTHPDGRLQRLRPNVPHPGDVRPGWKVLGELAAAPGPRDRHRLRARGAGGDRLRGPHLRGDHPEEIGGRGMRWQEREQRRRRRGGRTHSGAGTARRASAEPSRRAPPRGTPPTGLRLGTYRDLWAGEVTERNAALQFLRPSRARARAADAERLGVSRRRRGDVSSNGTRSSARVAIRERMRPGAAS